MADNREPTLRDLIDKIRGEGQLTRNTGTNSLKSLREAVVGAITPIEIMTRQSLDISSRLLFETAGIGAVIRDMSGNLVGELEGINQGFAEMFQRMREEEDRAREKTSAHSSFKPGSEKQNDNLFDKLSGLFGGMTNGGGLFAPLFRGLGLGAGMGLGLLGVPQLKNFLTSLWTSIFSPKAIGAIMKKLSPLAIMAGVVSTITGFFTEWMNSDAETLSGRIMDALSGALGQLAEFISFGLIDKDEVIEFLDPVGRAVDDFSKDLSSVISGALEGNFEPLLRAASDLSDWRSDLQTKAENLIFDALGWTWENLGFMEFFESYQGTKITGSMWSEKFKEWRDDFNDWITGGMLDSLPVIDEFPSWDKIVGGVDSLASDVASWFDGLWADLGELDPMKELSERLIKPFSEWLDSAMTFSMPTLDDVAMKLGLDEFPSMDNIMKRVADAMNGAFQDAAQWIMDNAPFFGETLSQAFSDMGNSIAGALGGTTISSPVASSTLAGEINRLSVGATPTTVRLVRAEEEDRRAGVQGAGAVIAPVTSVSADDNSVMTNTMINNASVVGKTSPRVQLDSAAMSLYGTSFR